MKITPEQIAQVCHEANRVYCAIIGDHSQPVWTGARAWQRKSIINGVKNVFLESRRGGPSAVGNHDNWMTEKLKAGWKYGAVKDIDKKEHPSLLPFHELPEEEQIKDRLFIAIVLTLMALVEEEKEDKEG